MNRFRNKIKSKEKASHENKSSSPIEFVFHFVEIGNGIWMYLKCVRAIQLQSNRNQNMRNEFQHQQIVNISMRIRLHFISINNGKDKNYTKNKQRSGLMQSIRLQFIGHIFFIRSVLLFSIMIRFFIENLSSVLSCVYKRTFLGMTERNAMPCHSNMYSNSLYSHARQSWYK